MGWKLIEGLAGDCIPQLRYEAYISNLLNGNLLFPTSQLILITPISSQPSQPALRRLLLVSCHRRSSHGISLSLHKCKKLPWPQVRTLL